MTQTAELRTELCLLLGEAAPPDGRFTQVELDYILGEAEDVYEAAYIGWGFKVDKLIEAGALVQSITTGSESYRFASMKDLESYCKRKADYYAAKSTSTALVGSSGLIVGAFDPQMDGIIMDEELIEEGF